MGFEVAELAMIRNVNVQIRKGKMRLCLIKLVSQFDAKAKLNVPKLNDFNVKP